MAFHDWQSKMASILVLMIMHKPSQRSPFIKAVLKTVCSTVIIALQLLPASIDCTFSLLFAAFGK